MADIGRRICEERHAADCTQEQLAEKLRVDARTVQRLERGVNLTLPRLIQIASVLRVPIEAFFRRPESRRAPAPGRPRRTAR